MRCLMRFAVTCFDDQMGVRIAMTSAVVTSSTRLDPMRGNA